MVKRGTSGLSLLLGVDKPLHTSSHDVVNCCRRLFAERRVGHCGTLDPLASGAMLVGVGPATRLNPYLMSQEKRYRFTIRFGAATNTDDAEGEIIRSGLVPAEIYDEEFALQTIEGLVGTHKQIPPVFSAISIDGKRSYKEARKGNIIEIAPRDIEIYSAQLVSVGQEDEAGYAFWDVEVKVSKGTYIRAIARDVGNTLGVPAHVGALRRTASGGLDVECCATLEQLEADPYQSVIDPVRLLAYRLIFLDEQETNSVKNGAFLSGEGRSIFRYPHASIKRDACFCTTGIIECDQELQGNEMISVVAQNKLVGLYRFEHESMMLKPQCIFAVGVSRGRDL